MKKILFISTIIFSFCIVKSVNSQVVPKAHWENFSTSDGLISNNIQDVLVEDKSNIWLATDAGLSHFDGASFTNYTNTNSTLPDNDIKELLYTQNRLWLRTSSGLSSFDGTVFTNYSTANGLLTNTIKDITCTSDDTLWMCSNSGTSKFDGLNFTHYPSLVANFMEADDSNRIYVATVVGVPRAGFVSLYENGIWSSPSPTGLGSAGVFVARGLKRTKDGELYATTFNDNRYYEISYPLNYELKSINLETPVPHQGSDVNLTIIEKKAGKLWAGCMNPRFLCSTRDSVARFYRINNLNLNSTGIDLFQDLVAVGTNAGLYIANDSIEPSNDRGEDFEVNQIKTSVRITDPLFSDIINSVANFEYPKNSGNHGIYSANFIVAAKKQNQSNTKVHPLNGFSSSFAPGPISNTSGLSGDYLIKVSRQEILAHQTNFNQPSYAMPKGIKNWPAYGDTTLGIAEDLAPFVDANANGCYDPQNGDYPIIKGDEAIYWINHPDDQSLELEYHWMLYGFNSPNTELDQTVFVQYTIVNRAAEVYDSVKVGFYLDPDLGLASDDYVGCDSLNDIMYAYNSSLGSSIPGYTGSVPALGVKFISDSLSNLMSFNIGPASNGDPSTAQHWVDYMNSRWKNGQQLKYGGDGFSSSTVTNNVTTHMLTGDPFNLTGWSELTANVGSSPNQGGDRRIFGSIPYFSLQPNERKTIEIAVGYGATGDSVITQIGQNISTMIDVLRSADSAWSTIIVPTANFATTDSCNMTTSLATSGNSEKGKLKVFPVPTNGDLTIESDEKIQEVQLFDMRGVLVSQKFENKSTVNLILGELEEGFFILRVRKIGGDWENKKIIVIKQ